MKLKNCPFCGLNAAYITKNECLSNGFVSFTLHHTTNACILSGWYDTDIFETAESAVKAWNKRNVIHVIKRKGEKREY